MAGRRGRGRKALRGAQRVFAERVACGMPPADAAVSAYGGALAADQAGPQAELLLGEPEVIDYLVKQLRVYAWSWVSIERASRAVLSRALMGEEEDGTPLEMSGYQLECLRLDAAKTALAALSKSAPETFVAKARAEDVARLDTRALAVRLLGPVQVEGEVVDEVMV